MSGLFGGGGGTTTGKTEVPAYIQDAHKRSLADAESVSEIGYVPYYGADVAAFSPMQQQSMRSTGNTASAFGMAPAGFDGTADIPQAQTFAGGIQGYSSAPLYEDALAQLEARRPAQYAAINDRFIDPFTGSRPRRGGGYGTSGGSDYAALAAAGGGLNNEPTAPRAQTEGEYFGVNRQYNPYKYSMPTENISGADGVIDYRDMSFGEGGRRDVHWSENLGKVLPFGNLPNIFDQIGTKAFNWSDEGDAPMTQAEAMQRMNAADARYNNRDYSAVSGGLLSGGLNQNLDQIKVGTQKELEQRLAIDAQEEQQYQQRKSEFEQRQRESAQRLAILTQGNAQPSRAIGVSGTGAGLNQRGSTYSGGGQAAASGYGGISGGGGR